MDKQELKQLVKKAVLSAQRVGKLPSFDVPEPIIEFPEREEHGDYTTNIAFSISKLSGVAPQVSASVIREELDDKLGNSVAVFPPGFINFRASRKELIGSLEEIIKKGKDYGRQKDKKTMVIDYSAPNIAKPFGIGHLRSTIIGQAIYNIYQFLGWKCIGDNHLGDWGTQFGKLIVAIKKWGDEKKLDINQLEAFYVRFHAEAETDKSLLEEAKLWFKKLEKGDKEAKRIWEICVDISQKEFDRIYKLLGVTIDHAFGESFYEDKMEAVLEEAKRLGVAKKSQGALVLELPGFKTPLMLLKSDGATTYETREMATIKYRQEKWHPDLIVWEVGVDQKLHFQKAFKAAKILGYKGKTKFIHVAHGLIRWPDRKFSTRRGDTIKLEDILKAAIKKAEEISKESAKKVGIGAVKYNDLSRHYSRDIIFDLDRTVTLEGNSGPYIQYTAVRCKSVLDKAKVKKFKVESLNKEEELLLRSLRKFPEIVQEAADNFSPNLICSFVYNLAQKYNLFYEKHSILQGENKEFRLALTKGVLQILENSLNLLGIEVPEKM